MKQKPVLTLTAITLLTLVLSTGSALAAGAGAVSITQTFHDAVQTMTTANPCSGAIGTLTTTSNGVAHITFLTSGIGAGTGWITVTMTGSFTFIPFDPSQPTFTGKSTFWDGASFNLNNFASTMILIAHGTGSDGSTLTFHAVAHITILNPTTNPTVVVTFNNLTCG